MSLREKLATPPTRAKVGPIDRWLGTLSETDRVALDAALRDPSWRHVDLFPIVKDEGAPVHSCSTFGKWRREYVSR